MKRRGEVRGGRRRRAGDWRALGKVMAALPLSAGGERPADDDAQRRLAAFWRRRFGAQARSEALLFDSGRLAVFVEAAAFGHEIRHLAPGLLRELAQAGVDAKSVTVKVRPPLPPPLPLPPRKTRPPLRLSATSAAQLEALANTVSHAPLAEALRSLAKKTVGGDGGG